MRAMSIVDAEKEYHKMFGKKTAASKGYTQIEMDLGV